MIIPAVTQSRPFKASTSMGDPFEIGTSHASGAKSTASFMSFCDWTRASNGALVASQRETRFGASAPASGLDLVQASHFAISSGDQHDRSD